MNQQTKIVYKKPTEYDNSSSDSNKSKFDKEKIKKKIEEEINNKIQQENNLINDIELLYQEIKKSIDNNLSFDINVLINTFLNKYNLTDIQKMNILNELKNKLSQNIQNNIEETPEIIDSEQDNLELNLKNQKKLDLNLESVEVEILQNKGIFKELENNNINTWLFICALLISFIIFMMIFINKK